MMHKTIQSFQNCQNHASIIVLSHKDFTTSWSPRCQKYCLKYIFGRLCSPVTHVKYVINFDFPTGHLFSFEYLQRMTNISCKNASVISYFGLDDFTHSDVFVELLIHMKQVRDNLYFVKIFWNDSISLTFIYFGQKINPLLYEMKIVTELENTTHDMFNDELKRSIANSTNDLMEFVTNLMRTKRNTNEDDDRASTSSGASSKRLKNT
jgi:hypothetical protein